MATLRAAAEKGDICELERLLEAGRETWTSGLQVLVAVGLMCNKVMRYDLCIYTYIDVYIVCIYIYIVCGYSQQNGLA